MIKERFEFVLTVAYLLCLVLLGLCIEESYYILAEHLFNSTAKTATCESQCLQGLAKSWSPGCVNVAGKTRQKCKQQQQQSSPNLGPLFSRALYLFLISLSAERGH